MKHQRSGSIVNISSIAGLVGLKERVAYCASKGAILAMTRALAVDLALDGIRVNCVCPGTTATAQMIRVVRNDADRVELAQRQALGRLGEPDEIASAVVYLCLPEASFITGAVIPVDGGMTAR
jgi:NAD(P)-dependent dehydrogenase (short-subunit alcohol dehydrogenase family)